MSSFAGRSETLNQHFDELTVTSDIFNELSAQFVLFDVCVCYLVSHCLTLLYFLTCVKCKDHELYVS